MRATAAVLLGTVLIASACHAGGNAEETHGPTAQRDFQVAGVFDRIALAGSSDVVVTVGGAASVRAEGDADTLERLEIANVGGELRIGMRPSSGNWFRWRHHRVTVHVTLPALAAATIAGSGDMRIDRVDGARFAGAVTGSGDLSVAAATVGEANFSVTGSGDIVAAGRAERASATVVGSGDLRLRGLEAADATISVAGSGNIDIRATRSAAVELRGSGDIEVAGPARCTISKSGSGEVRCEG
jgi:hypothetical protein